MDAPTVLKEYFVFSFATFALVEPFGLAPYIPQASQTIRPVSPYSLHFTKPALTIQQLTVNHDSITDGQTAFQNLQYIQYKSQALKFFQHALN